MVHHASRLIANEFDRCGIKYGGHVLEEGESSYVQAAFSIENGPPVIVRYFSKDDYNDVSVHAHALFHFSGQNRGLALSAANDFNDRYRFLRFVVDNHNNLNVEFDFPVGTSDERVGAIAVEIFMRYTHVLNDLYPTLLQLVSGDTPAVMM